ncbi:MAG: hypothetical protein IJ157_09400 [Clostridia bacterium]|nr:hypothetical protein [Clostridia bacterium]
MKKLICLLLCLLLPMSALAAPTRELRESALSEAELSTMRAWLDSAAREALPLEYDDNTYVGALVYSCVEDGGCYVLECDVYAEEGGDSLPHFAPDESITWLCDATICVRRDGDGYALVSCETGDYYAFGGMTMLEADDFSVSLPDLYAVNDDDAYDFSYYAEDGSFISGVRYRVEDALDLNREEYARQLLGEENDGLIINDLPEVNMLTAQDTGMYVIIYSGDSLFHSLTITYPEEREAEFTLYAEFMRNSFVVAGEVNG